MDDSPRRLLKKSPNAMVWELTGGNMYSNLI
jgi:hypothetical protein